MKIKVLLFISFIFLSLKGETQIWKYPPKILGLSINTNYVNNKVPAKVILVDSTNDYGIRKTYREYDDEDRLIKEKFMWLKKDTTFYFYDEKNREIMKIWDAGDTVYNIYKMSRDDRVAKKMVINNNDTLNIDYQYNSEGEITKVFCDSTLCQMIKYKEGRIKSVHSYEHDNNGISDITTYSYNGDTISYTECPYDTEGNRYDWPCERTIGIVDGNKKIQEIKSIYYNTTQDGYEEAFTITKYTYDSNGRITSVKDESSTGSWSEILIFYNNDGFKTKVKWINNGELFREQNFIILKN